MDRLAKRWLPHREILIGRLARTGRNITLGQYVLVALGTGLAVAVLSMTFIKLVGPLYGGLLLGVFAGIALPHLLIGRLGKKRVARFIALFPEAIDLMVRALRSGLPISEALINCAHEIGAPVGTEFGTIESGMRLVGAISKACCGRSPKRIDTPEYKFFIIALSVQRETGGNLAETLANLADVLSAGAERCARRPARWPARRAPPPASSAACRCWSPAC